MKLSLTRIVLALVTIGIVGAGIGYMLYNKPHADLAGQAADHTVTAEALLAAFEADEAAANAQYLDKLVEVTGTLQERTATQDGGQVLVLREADAFAGVSCAFLPGQAAQVADLQPGASLTIRGICSGMLMDVNLSRCIVVE